MKKVLVIHPDDRSTDMLKAVYEGKGYDVISDSRISDEEMVEQIKSHDKIIMLGHGTPYGLISWNRTTGEVRYVINDSLAEILKTKETYSMWCHSDAFFERHDMKGFHSGMIISEEMEALMYGIVGYSDEDIAESMMPLMYAMHDTIEMEDLEEMKRIILERYNAKDPVTWFNRRNIVIL
jgi:hypothetical protein